MPSPKHSTKPVTHSTSGSALDYPPTNVVHHQHTHQAGSYGAEAINFVDLPAIIRQDYAQHDPMALFPEPSSTVANATQTQQRLLAGISGPGLLGSESDSVGPQLQHHPQPSVPWSELLNLSPAGAGEQSDSNQRSEEASENHVPASERSQDTFISQPVRQSSAARPGDSPLRHEVVSEHFSLKEPTPLPHAAGPSQNARKQSSNIAQAKHNSQCSSTRLPREQLDVYETQSSEDELMGLPKEQYNPQPSRSRLLKISNTEPVDYSVRPEKAAKGSKRRKPRSSATATRSASANDSLSTPEKVKQICEMGFTPTSTGKALDQNHGDVTQTIEWLINNGMGEDELAQSNTPKRRSATKLAATDRSHVANESPALKVPVVEDIRALSKSLVPAVVLDPESKPLGPQEVIHPHLDEAMVSHGDHLKSPKVQVVIPSKSPRTKSEQQESQPQGPSASKKPKRRKTTSDLPVPDPGCGLPAAVEPKTEKKKRGRPKKVANAILPPEDRQEETVETNIPPKVPTEEKGTSNNVQQNIEAAAEYDPSVVETGDSKVEDAPKSPALPQKESSVQQPSTASHTPEQATKTPSRSPTGKGKVSYRVGLSRRARIAPLLRMVKK